MKHPLSSLIGFAFLVGLVFTSINPAQAGWFDWLTGGDKTSGDTATSGEKKTDLKDELLADPTKGSVRVDMTMTLAGGKQLVDWGYCKDMRRSPSMSCEVKMKSDLLPKNRYWLESKKSLITFTFKKWPNADDQFTLTFRSLQSSFALNSASSDASLIDLNEGTASLSLRLAGGEADEETQQHFGFGRPVAVVTFKISPDDRMK